MRCEFVGTDGCETETPVMLRVQQFGRKTTVWCCSACWRILTDGATAPEPEPARRIQVPQPERKQRVQLGLTRSVAIEKPRVPVALSDDLFG